MDIEDNPFRKYTPASRTATVLGSVAKLDVMFEDTAKVAQKGLFCWCPPMAKFRT
jgi:hypothetical protein